VISTEGDNLGTESQLGVAGSSPVAPVSRSACTRPQRAVTGTWRRATVESRKTEVAASRSAAEVVAGLSETEAARRLTARGKLRGMALLTVERRTCHRRARPNRRHVAPEANGNCRLDRMVGGGRQSPWPGGQTR
jgi:hypothetical protein